MPVQPEYLRVIDDVTALIARREWAPGQRLPRVVDLAEQFGVTVGTMRRALMLLQDRGVLEGRQGKAIFVAGAPER